ncbi:MAG: concanavalin A-like lectin/glucanase [Siphoviridae sp. ctCJE6]|nr:MAG: concanavalin A-like lectin/glucanase [Siphoviridae sp. ctCJE6]
MIRLLFIILCCLNIAATNWNDNVNCMGSWAMTSGSTETDLSGEGGTLTESASDDIPTGTSCPDIYSACSSRDFELGDTEDLSHADGLSTDISGANQAISFVAWIKPESLSISNHEVISKYVTTDNQRQYNFFVASDGSVTCQLSPDGTSSTGVAVTATGVITTGAWYHIGCVYNDTDIRVYVNGVLSSNGASNPKAYTSGIFDSTALFHVGARISSSGQFDGLITDVGVFNDALTAAEVFEIYSHGMNGVEPRRMF